MKLSRDQKKMLIGSLAGLAGGYIGSSLFAILGRITWGRVLEIMAATTIGYVIAVLFLLLGSRVPKAKDGGEAK